MLFRQLYDLDTGTYTYLLAERPGGEAVIIDPVLEQMNAYLQLLRELDIRLVKAIDTHTHADHVTAMGKLREVTGCVTLMGEQTKAECVSLRVRDGEAIRVGALTLRALYTPGIPTNPTVSSWTTGCSPATPC